METTPSGTTNELSADELENALAPITVSCEALVKLTDNNDLQFESALFIIETVVSGTLKLAIPVE